ncbi:hypothetical protein NUU61_007851 [Penicillium alfredii]|uniref:Uncharacterized protein n=1 Tax=Penicillium alfredii TaxID=1506179 RepID=A0A9W9ERL7_9EURO|nr:uncharacterized protein NUU61_007851 [Penicillium alfredii]KAJ5086544.1 hypothetical protein NUU61_007851 [Penicillium alfredii]
MPSLKSPCSAPSPQAPSKKRFRFKSSKYQAQESPLSSNTGSEETPEISTEKQGSTPDIFNPNHGSISIPDLKLFHHYVTEAYRTLADQSMDRNRVWQTHLPQWGFSSPSIFHLILALSALHLGYLQPELRDQYVMQADSHFTFGIRSVTAVLSKLDPENCQLIYMSAVLICLVYFGHGPRLGEYLVFGETGKAEWLVLMRGVRSILHAHRSKIFTGVLEPQPDPSIQGVGPLLQDELCQQKYHVEKVRQLIDSQHLDVDTHIMYAGAIDNLLEMFEEAYAFRSAGKDGICVLHVVVGWIYRRPEEFINLLEAKDPLAMVVLAHWCMLLKFMRSSWLMVGWDEHVIRGIQTSLRADYRGWISWPVSFIQS